jgi:hypothetical protein
VSTRKIDDKQLFTENNFAKGKKPDLGYIIARNSMGKIDGQRLDSYLYTRIRSRDRADAEALREIFDILDCMGRT